ncbi:MAG TPA: hypothetical protein VMW27_23990 [Thermoanaerobaculia bacterium]|nr:hypothetical protein [Thermoanaerobaculia bacterium]
MVAWLRRLLLFSTPAKVTRHHPAPWRPSPFVPGARYRVRRDFAGPRNAFSEGEVLTYRGDCYSPYDSYTGYLFTQEGDERFRVWDVHDEEDTNIWRKLFEEVQG